MLYVDYSQQELHEELERRYKKLIRLSMTADSLQYMKIRVFAFGSFYLKCLKERIQFG